jgi:hypothetical protein
MSDDLAERVAAALDQALENDYDLTDWKAADVADDLISHSADFNSSVEDDLIPHIEAWQALRKAARTPTPCRHGVRSWRLCSICNPD